MASELAVVGKRLTRPDVAAKATGSALYTTDMTLPGMLTAAVLRSPHAHARIVKIDTSRAAKLPGVMAVLTTRDVPDKLFNMGTSELLIIKKEHLIADQHVLNNPVRYAGEAVAAVAAVDEATAQAALELIEVEYEVLPAVFDPLEAIKPGAPRVHDFAGNNIAQHLSHPYVSGDVEKGFRESDAVIEGTFTTSKQKTAPLEPASCVASFDANGRVTVWSPAQRPFLARRRLGEAFDIPEGKIRWITPLIGGGFGNGASLRAEPICVALAQKTRRPVKLEYSREEQFVATETRTRFVQMVKLGVKKDGTMIALQTRVIADAGAYFSATGSITGVNMAYLLGLYRVPNTAGQADIVYTNTTPSGAVRGYGNPEGMFALEQVVDMAAEKIGMDPMELRLKNHRTTGEPSRSPSITIESCRLAECMQLGAEKIGWKEKRATRNKAGIKRRGLGMAVTTHNAGSFPRMLDYTNATIKLNEDGSANLTAGCCELGQGITGVVSQIAAEALGMHAQDIVVYAGDTDVNEFDAGCVGSRATYNIGNAVVRAASEAKQKLLERAAKMLEAEPGELEAREGRVFFKVAPDKGITIAEVAKDAIYNFKGDAGQISGHCSWEAKWNTPAFEAVFAEVEVDTETGEVRVIKVAQAHDIGRAINPLTVEGQLEGSIMQGMGWALTEDFAVNSKGILESDNFTSYKIPSSMDIPETEVLLVEYPIESGPFGAKSVGECGVNAIAPAIANAISDATGIRLFELPMNPERVLHALHRKEAGGLSY
ncbi:MAG: molybdopterin-dependent oxidoreductase [Chloroflexi bacterium]|nr:molybdopterin-dependent oxidoreductase [Chloroflexota bacterium]